MKQFKTLAASLAFLLLTSCSNNNSDSKTATTQTETPDNAKPSASSGAVQGEGLVGEWEMQGSVLDTNDNLQIDEDERKNIKAPSFKDYMKLNSDGSGEFTVAKMEGRYEVTEEAGKKKLKWVDKENGEHRIGTIIKVSGNELHIKEPGGAGLFVWKRI